MRSPLVAFVEDSFEGTAERALLSSRLDETEAGCSPHTGLREARQGYSIGRRLLRSGSIVGPVKGL